MRIYKTGTVTTEPSLDSGNLTKWGNLVLCLRTKKLQQSPHSRHPYDPGQETGAVGCLLRKVQHSTGFIFGAGASPLIGTRAPGRTVQVGLL